MNNPTVYVILLNWNGYKDTYKCITSLLHSDYPVDIIVVDNNSTDRDIDKISDEFPEVHYIKHHTNSGFSKGNNIGIQFALTKDAEYIFILNNDTTVNDNCISELVEFMEMNETAVAASPLILHGDAPHMIWYGGGTFNWRRGGARSYRLNIELNDTKLPHHETIEFMSGCAMFVRADALRHTKGFDENFFMYVEDVELSIRLNTIGDMYLVPGARICHYVHSTLHKNANKKFSQPASPLNENLNFYLDNVLRGYFYLLAKHQPVFRDRLGFYLYFYLRWIRRAFLYLLKGKFHSTFLIFKILATPFHQPEKM